MGASESCSLEMLSSAGVYFSEHVFRISVLAMMLYVS